MKPSARRAARNVVMGHGDREDTTEGVRHQDMGQLPLELRR